MVYGENLRLISVNIALIWKVLDTSEGYNYLIQVRHG